MRRPIISREHRAVFVILVDLSASMLDFNQCGGRIESKCDFVIKKVNEILRELYCRAHRGRKIYDYYDIAVIAYSGDGVEFISTPDRSPRLISVTKLYQDFSNYLSLAPRNSGDDLFAPHGGRGAVVCHPNGLTPIGCALDCLYELFAPWFANEANRGSIAPMVINISDGISTDCDDVSLHAAAERLKSLGSDRGGVLLMNIFLSSASGDRSLNFPTDEQIEQFEDPYVATLASISSYMPEYYRQAIESVRPAAEGMPYRAMCYNVDMSRLMEILIIGTTTLVGR